MYLAAIEILDVTRSSVSHAGGQNDGLKCTMQRYSALGRVECWGGPTNGGQRIKMM